LREVASSRLRPLFLDVTEPASIQAAATLVQDSLGPDGLQGLVNNAGVGLGGPVEYLDLDEVRKGFEVNVFGAIALTQALLPLLRTGRGRIANISSISGLVAMPFVGPYAASKFALEAFSDALRVELRPWRIPVSLVELGAVDTAIWGKGQLIYQRMVGTAPEGALARYGMAMEAVSDMIRPHGAPPVKIARVVAKALTASRPQPRYRADLEARLMTLFRLMPDRFRDWLIASQIPGWL
jgi:NAD(P)-dependent dehydrogenase (short-subunit alcohol dehydrogenase family)